MHRQTETKWRRARGTCIHQPTMGLDGRRRTRGAVVMELAKSARVISVRHAPKDCSDGIEAAGRLPCGVR